MSYETIFVKVTRYIKTNLFDFLLEMKGSDNFLYLLWYTLSTQQFQNPQVL